MTEFDVFFRKDTLSVSDKLTLNFNFLPCINTLQVLV